MFSLRREIDRLFDDAFGGGRANPTWAPAVDVREDEREISVNIELPGIKPEEVDISVENGVLTIRGEKRAERKEGEEGRYHIVERTYGNFFRSFQLPQGIDEDQISADFQNGVLTVRIPKAALPQPRRIQIGGGQQQVTGGAEQTRERGAGRASAGQTQTTSRGGKQGGEKTDRMAAGGREE